MRESWCVRRSGEGVRCAVHGCRNPHGVILLRNRPPQYFMCPSHRAEYTHSEVHPYLSCGCGPQLCGACLTYLESGKKVLVVGERRVGDPYPFDFLKQVRSYSSGDALKFLTNMGAFRGGSSRTRLLNTGIRWDAALNLLPPSRAARWLDADHVVASAVAQHLEPAMAQWDVVLVGRHVEHAFALGPHPAPRVSLIEGCPWLFLPHPSGRNRCWNSQEVVGRCREVVGDFLLRE